MKKSTYSRRYFLKQQVMAGAGVLLSSGLSAAAYAGTRGKEEEKQGTLSLSVFDVDATPPIGTHLAYDVMTGSSEQGLRAKGIVLHGAGEPIVLCAIDWIGIANESHDAFRQVMAAAAGTKPEKVSVHTVHQHDAFRCDFGGERILKQHGVEPMAWDGRFAREFLPVFGEAIKKAVQTSVPVTHIGLGEAPVYQVASNRRILGEDGRVRQNRMSSCKDPSLRAEPEGLIDPMVSLVSFWEEDRPLAVLSYYAVHPMSYYRTGIANPDFPGIARFMRQLAVPDALHVYFTGAAGNVAAGKYNDGSHTNRLVLAKRLADGMKRAWENTQKEKITAGQISWKYEPFAFTPAPHLPVLKKQLDEDPSLYKTNRGYARQMAWYERCLAGKKVDLCCLRIGKARILLLPGELSVEYQLTAKQRRPDLFVAMAAYGDYSMGYICTEKAYEEGGYEASEAASNVHSATEHALKAAIFKLLNA